MVTLCLALSGAIAMLAYRAPVVKRIAPAPPRCHAAGLHAAYLPGIGHGERLALGLLLSLHPGAGASAPAQRAFLPALREARRKANRRLQKR
jgi:hypothetical protein